MVSVAISDTTKGWAVIVKDGSGEAYIAGYEDSHAEALSLRNSLLPTKECVVYDNGVEYESTSPSDVINGGHGYDVVGADR